MSEEDKYGPVEGAKWKRVNARFPNLYKALLEEPDKATCGELYISWESVH